MEEILKQILSEVSGLRSEVSEIKTTMATKEDIIRLEAKFDSIAHEGEKNVNTILLNHTTTSDVLATLATKDSVLKVETKIDLINNKLFQTETEIALLKLVK